MVYCSNCGKELTGAKRFCSYCGFSVDAEDVVEVEPVSESRDVKFEKETEDLSDASIPEAAIKVNKDCIVCGVKSETKCFFCNTYVCKRHYSNMQILADKSPIGNDIIACGSCADHKSSTQPTEAEAKEMGFFFKIKPYHQWTIIH